MTIIGIIIFVLSPFIVMFILNGMIAAKSLLNKFMKRNEVVPTRVLAHLIASRILSAESFNENNKIWEDREKEIRLYYRNTPMEVWGSGKQIFLDMEDSLIINDSIKKAKKLINEKTKNLAIFENQNKALDAIEKIMLASPEVLTKIREPSNRKEDMV